MPTGRPSGRGRGRGRGSTNTRQATETPSASASASEQSDEALDSDEVEHGANQRRRARAAPRAAPRATDQTEEAAAPEKSIPKDLLTRMLHEFFTKEATRISRDANAAVGKYMDIFVREAIARAAVEKNAGFLEVEDLEKIAPQLLLDL
ncbi:hypothetical protein E4U43_007383 [Claviceps pusilla]|uniref:Centromere protein X n=1 Tax=Claviceps pusilla TaxID=123648 RepID=A0A9P7NCN8_9HYPO|nr:hypothetical protein E4U43_007383 [Claviceps pusilla]